MALEFESVTIGYVFKAEYFLPENASNVLDIISDPFNPTIRPISGTGRRRRRRLIEGTPDNGQIGYDAMTNQKYEKYDVQAVEIESGTRKTEEYEDYEEDDTEEVNGPSTNEENEMNDDEIDEHFTLQDIKIKQPNNIATARFSLYKGIERMADR